MRRLDELQLGDDRLVAWQQRADGDVFARQRRRQRADDIGQAAGLDQRIVSEAAERMAMHQLAAILSIIG